MKTYLALLVLSVIAVEQIYAETCDDNSSFLVKSKIELTCDTLLNLPYRTVRKLCNKNTNMVMDKCCETCKKVKVKPEEGVECVNREGFNMQTRAKLTCAEFSENAKEDMMKLCKNGKKNVADNCCQTCTQLTIPPFHTTPAPSTPPQTTPRQTTPGTEPLGPGESIIHGQCIKTVGPHGGSGGSPFSDQEKYFQHGKITHVMVRAGTWIDCLGFIYNNVRDSCHGGEGGGQKVIALLPGEYIVRIHGTVKWIIKSLYFDTNKRLIGHYGGLFPALEFDLEADGRKLAYISGKSGMFVDQLTAHFLC